MSKVLSSNIPLGGLIAGTSRKVGFEWSQKRHTSHALEISLEKSEKPNRINRLDSLSAQIQNLHGKLKPSNEQLEEKTEFLMRLQRSIDNVMDGAVVAPFGSAVNGFWSPNSDIDVCIQLAGCRRKADQVNALRKIANSLHAISSHYIEPRFGARVPIIHWAPRRSGYLACDISINNNLAVINSRLIGTYCSIDPRMAPLGMAIKHWAKARGINDRSRGTLSSFSLLLMLVHFLQHRTPPILPSLQDLAFELNEPLMYLDGADVRFMRNPEAISAEIGRITDGKLNSESLGELFYEFFKYYGYEYKQGIIGVRDLRQFDLPSMTDRSTYLVVDNPFEVGKDVANVNPSQHGRIRQEFRRAKSLMDESGDVSLASICAIAEVPTMASKSKPHPLDPPPQILGRTTPKSARPPS